MIADCIGGLLLFYSLQATSLNSDSISLSTIEDSFSFKGSSLFNDNQMSPENKAENLKENKSSVSLYDFVVNGVFVFGSPIGITAYKDKLSSKG